MSREQNLAKDIFRQVDERAREAGSVILIAEIYHSKNEDEKARFMKLQLSPRCHTIKIH